MRVLLEEQERQIMLHGEPPPPTDKHEISMILELEQNLKKLQDALDALGQTPAASKIYKEIEKRSGNLITGIRWAVDGVKPDKADIARKATKDDLPLWVKSVTPKLESLIRARKRQLINLEITQVVLNQLFLIQSLAKELARTPS